MPVLALHVHAGFRCRHSGACCTAGWPIPVERDVADAVREHGLLPEKALNTTGDRQKNIRMFGCKDIGSYELVREPNNPSDPNAIRVQVGEYLLGYVPRGHAMELAPMMDSGRSFIAYFVCRNEHPMFDTVGLTVRIEERPLQEAA